MKKIHVPTKSGTDWQRLLGKPDLHWKAGRSAMSAAACWEDSDPELPTEISKLLEKSNDPTLSSLRLLIAVPEWEVELPGGDRASQTDILAICRNDRELVVIGVEAKVDEPFGPTIGEKRHGASAGQLERLDFLERQLGRTTQFGDHIRYQLLHRTVSAMLTARDFCAPAAAMLIHSFSPEARWKNDFEEFSNELEARQIASDLYEVKRTGLPRLFLGWVKGNEKYLGVKLPSSM